MAKKDFSKINPLERLSGASNTNKSTELETEHPETVETEQADLNQNNEKQKTSFQKKKVGRPKTKDVKNTCRNINVAIPIELLDKWNEIKIIYGNNLTAYITKLIENDMSSKYEQYKNILNSLKNI